MFQLHLPRYSSATVLKDRLLTAIQNAGQRGDVGGALSSNVASHLEPDCVVMNTTEETCSVCLLKLPAKDGGHLENLSDFCERARIDQRHLERCLAVADMSQLLEMEPDRVRAALSRDKLRPDKASNDGDGETTSAPQLQQIRNKYEAMSLEQLKRCCSDLWLDAIGLKSDLVERLVAFDADAIEHGLDLAGSASGHLATQSQPPLQKADVARVMGALAQARIRWCPGDSGTPGGAPPGGEGSDTSSESLASLSDSSDDRHYDPVD